jgi:hypothetical protein
LNFATPRGLQSDNNESSITSKFLLSKVSGSPREGDHFWIFWLVQPLPLSCLCLATIHPHVRCAMVRGLQGGRTLRSLPFLTCPTNRLRASGVSRAVGHRKADKRVAHTAKHVVIRGCSPAASPLLNDLTRPAAVRSKLLEEPESPRVYATRERCREIRVGQTFETVSCGILDTTDLGFDLFRRQPASDQSAFRVACRRYRTSSFLWGVRGHGH